MWVVVNGVPTETEQYTPEPLEFSNSWQFPFPSRSRRVNATWPLNSWVCESSFFPSNFPVEGRGGVFHWVGILFFGWSAQHFICHFFYCFNMLIAFTAFRAFVVVVCCYSSSSVARNTLYYTGISHLFINITNCFKKELLCLYTFS